MASFESRVSEIFDENHSLKRRIPSVIRILFNMSEHEFKRNLQVASVEQQQLRLMKLHDILFIDLYYKQLDDRFLSWVIDHYPERFTSEELEEMRSQSASYYDFYEIQEVKPGQGSRIKSLFTGKEGFLKDVSSSYQFSKWDVFYSRCYLLNGVYYATGAVSLFQPSDKPYIMERMKQARDEFIREFGDEDFPVFAKNNWELFFQIEREIHEKAANRTVYTAFGKLQLCEVRFQVHDLNAILMEILDLDEFDFVEKKERRSGKKKKRMSRYQYDWLTLGIEDDLEKIRTRDFSDGMMLSTKQLTRDGRDNNVEGIGSFYVDALLGRIETRSLELAEFARDHFTSLFGDAITFKRIVKLNMEKVRNTKDESAPPYPPEHVPPELMRQIREQIFLKQLDEKVPMLNNMTPREARKIPEMMPILIEWVKEWENMLERKRKSVDDGFGIDFMKKALDINF